MNCKKLFIISVCVLLSTCFILSCSKENKYKANITVSLIYTDGNKIPVPLCKLIFGEDDFAANVKRTVYTNDLGHYEGEWNREVYLRIQASKEIDGQLYTGTSFIRLTPDGTAEQEILIKP
jgi:hypothetical protein